MRSRNDNNRNPMRKHKYTVDQTRMSPLLLLVAVLHQPINWSEVIRCRELLRFLGGPVPVLPASPRRTWR
jgi:hypothetical protein